MTSNMYLWDSILKGVYLIRHVPLLKENDCFSNGKANVFLGDTLVLGLSNIHLNHALNLSFETLW